MEISEENLRTLGEYLQHTLSPDPNVRRPAEKFLEGVEVNQNYPLLLLNLVDKPQIDMTIRVAGAVAFKNYIKRNWKIDDDQNDRIHATDRLAIKQLIVSLMLTSPEAIQKQLSDAISIIGKSDFPTKWPELIDQMVDKFATGDFHIINGVLQTAHSLFKKYRYEFKSNELWTEIKLVLDKLAKPLTDLLLATMNLAEQHAGNEQVLKVIYSSLVLVCKVFYSLNFQDLPEFFEDNMAIWMNNFHTLLTVQVKCLQTEDDKDAGILEQLKSQVCDNVSLYAQKYDEEFRQYLPQFVTDIWSLLVNTGLQPKYDLLVSNALQFLSSVADRAHYRNLFEDSDVLSQICEKVIIPNMEFRQSDEELFEDNPEEYLRRDIEGSDVDTRRRAACDLVNTLSQNFEQRIMDIFSQYIQVMLAKYMENPAQNWRSKDATLYLVTSLASRGQTQKHGVTQTSQLVSIPQFFGQHIIQDLERPDINELPVLKADAIKYIMTFRSILPKEVVIATLPQLIRYLGAESSVTHTYAACAIEKILVMRTPDHKLAVQPDQLVPLANNVLVGLFSVLNRPGSEENEYAMKAIMRSFSTLQENIIPFLGQLLPKLTEKLQLVARNPSKPNFNHYLFESISLSIKIVCSKNPSAVTSFEEVLFPIFQGILQQDIQEFMPYIFQILSLMMELKPPGNIPEPYLQLFPCLLAPALWERAANCSPLVRLLCAYITQAATQILEDKLSGLLGIFQKLIASKSNDGEGFILLQCLMQYYPSEPLLPFHKQIFFLLFQRLSSSKTTKYIIGLIVFFCFYCVNYSANDLVTTIDGIQPNMFGMVLEKVFLPDLQKVSGNTERKITACGIVKLICDCPAMFSGAYQKFWAPLFEALINFFEMPRDESILPDDLMTEIDELQPTSYSSNARLNFANNQKLDPLQAITEPRKFLVDNLSALCGTYPGQVPIHVNNMSDKHKNVLQGYLGKYGVQLL